MTAKVVATSKRKSTLTAQRLAAKFVAAAEFLAETSGVGEHRRTVACAVMALCGCRPRLNEAAQQWLLAAHEPACCAALTEAIDLAATILSDQTTAGDDIWPRISPEELDALPGPVACAEFFLAACDKKRRAAQGFYVTPPELALFILRGVDRSLRTEFGLDEGLLDNATWRVMIERHGISPPVGLRDDELDSPFVRVLDPAVGSGAFLVAAIETAYSSFCERETTISWSDVAAARLLPRLAGIELMPTVAVCAFIAVAETLQRTGYDFAHDAPLRVFVGDSLAPVELQRSLFNDEHANANCELDAVRRREPFTVIVGNPPFLAAALPGHRWVEQLLKGRDPDGAATANYYEAAGRPLAEKKLWLHDDYVKFLRYAHWRIDRAGCGVIGMVTNHGYLDNATFRGMRESLLHDFPRTSILDLHGSRKKKEQSPDGRADENVFAIEQGSAVALMRRPPKSLSVEIGYADLWGSRDEKLHALENNQAEQFPAVCLTPTAPHFFLVPHDERLAEEYRQGWSLVEAMPVNTTAPVTARDGFVVAFDRAELLSRMEEFRDLSISDDDIRSRYFNNTRSVRHAAGDTRGWKLSDARRELAADADWHNALRECLYRPFDVRSIYWSPTMIDWPRTDVMRHFGIPGNLALIARRQMPPGEPCSYFWIADRLTLDGVIRSDNRGSESVIPLFLLGDELDDAPRANFHGEFLREVEQRFGAIDPLDLLAYVYALFHANIYRTRYAEFLRIEFPRVFLPHDVSLFNTLRDRGSRLIELHTMRAAAAPTPPQLHLSAGATPEVAKGHPKYSSEAVHLNPQCRFAPVEQAIWEFRAGGHQVCRKWLKDRRGRTLSNDEISTYQSIVAAFRETLSLTASIDHAIQQAGDWQASFLPLAP